MHKAIKLLNKIIDFIMPPRCSLCSELTQQSHYLCHYCMNNVRYLPRYCCKICAYPFELDVGEDMLCGSCLNEKPNFDKAMAPFYYHGVIKDLILKLKHADQSFLAPTIANFMVAHLKRYDYLDYDLIIPVPLHAKKIYKRRYNQAMLIAKFISKKTNLPFSTRILIRHKDNTQKGKNRKERKTILKNNFKCVKPHLIKHKKILLVDDVMTTGSTVNEIARILKKNGAVQVDVITLARVSLDKSNKNIDF